MRVPPKAAAGAGSNSFEAEGESQSNIGVYATHKHENILKA